MKKKIVKCFSCGIKCDAENDYCYGCGKIVCVDCSEKYGHELNHEHGHKPIKVNKKSIKG
jgi:hypothetical protein